MAPPPPPPPRFSSTFYSVFVRLASHVMILITLLLSSRVRASSIYGRYIVVIGTIKISSDVIDERRAPHTLTR